MRISDWSSDVCSSDLLDRVGEQLLRDGEAFQLGALLQRRQDVGGTRNEIAALAVGEHQLPLDPDRRTCRGRERDRHGDSLTRTRARPCVSQVVEISGRIEGWTVCRSEEHTSELQSLMRISYAVFCLKKKTKKNMTVK